jgi:DNA-binding SARP family transcriptional activator/tetratricopeptide (TPR) repeat protein
VKFGLLGPLLVRDAAEIPVRGVKQRIMLAALLLDAGQVVPAGALRRYVWDGTGTDGSASALTNHVLRLRQTLGQAVSARIVTRPGGYVIQVSGDELDIHEFRRLAERGRQATLQRRWEQAAADLTLALRVWRGAPLLDIPSPLLQQEAAHGLAESRIQVLRWRIDADLQLGRHEDLVPELQALTGEQPLHEHFREQLMLALYRCGRQAEALEEFHALRRTLNEELAVEPGAAIRLLHERILAADPALAEPDGAPGAAITATSPVVQQPVRVPTQLPPDLADFTGRGTETGYLRDLFSNRNAPSPGAPVIATISGLGGVGKTALAVHAAHRLTGRFSHGQLFADLRGAGPVPAAAGEVLGDFLRALGVSDTAMPAEQDDRAALFRGLTATRRVLVVLDNAASTAQVRPLLPASASCGVIVTARRRLADLAGSTAIEADIMSAAEATAFLTVLAGRQPGVADNDQLAGLARMCGYLPLALRIAGARLAARPAWTVRDLTARLAGAQRLLDELIVGELAVRAAFDMSYQLLEPAQARAFRLLAIADLDDIPEFAAAALLGCQPAEATSFAESLVDLNLLNTPRPGRYDYHDLVRVFAREMAETTEPPAELGRARRRLLCRYRELAESPPGTSWLETECRNIIAQIVQGAGTLDAASAECAAILTAAQRQLRASGHMDGWRRASSAVLDSAIRTGDQGSELIAQQNLAQLAILSGDTADAAERLSRALALARHTADRHAEGYVLNRIGLLHFVSTDIAAALDSHWASLRIFEELSDRSGMCTALVNIGKTLVEDHQAEQALRALRRSLDIASAIPDRRFMIFSLHHMARAHAALGDHQQAMAIHRECLQATRESGDREGEAYALAEIGRVWLAVGQPDQALASLSTAVDLFAAMGASHPAATFLVDLGHAHDAAGNRTAALAAWEEALPLLDHADPTLAADVRRRIALGQAVTARAARAVSR